MKPHNTQPPQTEDSREGLWKSKLAKFGIFDTTENGADFLVTARSKDGKTLMTYAEAQERLNDFDNRHKMLIRHL